MSRVMPWPRVKVYRSIDADPEQVAAVFFDFEEAKSSFPMYSSPRSRIGSPPASWKLITGSTSRFFPMNFIRFATACDCSMRIRIALTGSFLELL